MAVDMFIKIGKIDGESQDKVYGPKKFIDVLAWSWGLSNSGSAHLGAGAGSGKVNVQDLSFTKYVDSSTPALLMAGCNGEHFDEANLIVRKAGTKPVEYIKIKLSEVLVTSVSTGGSGGEDRLTENVTLNFAVVHLDYTPQKTDGSAGTAIPFEWDIALNAKE
jgi:type VI secretion system secreted protein Hcp